MLLFRIVPETQRKACGMPHFGMVFDFVILYVFVVQVDGMVTIPSSSIQQTFHFTHWTQAKRFADVESSASSFGSFLLYVSLGSAT